MIWIKSLLIGLAAAIAAIVFFAAVVLATATWSLNTGEGGGIGAVSFGFSDVLLLPVIGAFALGVWWSLRRERKKRSVSSA
jgi:H+/Cl- antiporter ClcA